MGWFGGGGHKTVEMQFLEEKTFSVFGLVQFSEVHVENILPRIPML
jgi:hypothetical protein